MGEEHMTWSRNLEDYVKIYPGWCSSEACQNAVSSLEQAESSFELHAFYDAYKDAYLSYANELSVSSVDIQQKTYIAQRVWDALTQYYNDLSAAGCFWHGSWQGFTEIRFNRYRVDTQMALHCDHIHSMFDGERKGIPVLSIVGCLNEDYEGGAFVFFGDTIVSLKTGDIMIFPSNFLYPHQVNPVTSGTRYSFVSWTW